MSLVKYNLLGLQLLFDVSFEDGEHEGLGIVPGQVVRFDVPPEFKVPHMGWNEGRIMRSVPILAGIEEGWVRRMRMTPGLRTETGREIESDATGR